MRIVRSKGYTGTGNRLRQGPGASGKDRKATGHCFDDGDAESFMPRGHDEEIRRPIEVEQCILGNVSKKMHAITKPDNGRPLFATVELRFIQIRIIAGNHEVNRWRTVV